MALNTAAWTQVQVIWTSLYEWIDSLVAQQVVAWNGQEIALAFFKGGKVLQNAARSSLHFIITPAAEKDRLYCSDTMQILNSDR